MHDCASILDSIAKGITLFSHGASHPYIFIHDFCTCSTNFCINADTRMRTCVG